MALLACYGGEKLFNYLRPIFSAVQVESLPCQHIDVLQSVFCLVVKMRITYKIKFFMKDYRSECHKKIGAGDEL